MPPTISTYAFPPPSQPQRPKRRQPQPREIPPDQKAYADAGKLTDPAQKIAAYEKIKKD